MWTTETSQTLPSAPFPNPRLCLLPRPQTPPSGTGVSGPHHTQRVQPLLLLHYIRCPNPPGVHPLPAQVWSLRAPGQVWALPPQIHPPHMYVTSPVGEPAFKLMETSRSSCSAASNPPRLAAVSHIGGWVARPCSKTGHVGVGQIGREHMPGHGGSMWASILCCPRRTRRAGDSVPMTTTGSNDDIQYPTLAAFWALGSSTTMEP